MKEKAKRIGVIGIIVRDRKSSASRVNDILSDHGDCIIGRMGIPYDAEGINVIAIIIHGTTDDIGALTGKLGSLKDVDVRSVLVDAKGDRK